MGRGGAEAWEGRGKFARWKARVRQGLVRKVAGPTPPNQKPTRGQPATPKGRPGILPGGPDEQEVLEGPPNYCPGCAKFRDSISISISKVRL